MEVFQTTILFGENDLDFSGLGPFFKDVEDRLKDGYVEARRGLDTCFLFFIQGRPYGAAITGPEEKRRMEISDFFAWYRQRGSADVDVVEADKKVLLCMLVKLTHSPTQSFSTDVVNLEGVIEKIEKQGKDAIMALRAGETPGPDEWNDTAAGVRDQGRWHFAIFLDGEGVFATTPQQGASHESPLERLLVYAYSLAPESPLCVEIYADTRVSPSADAARFIEEGERDVVACYAGSLPVEPPLETLPGLTGNEPEIGAPDQEPCEDTGEEAGEAAEEDVAPPSVAEPPLPGPEEPPAEPPEDARPPEAQQPKVRPLEASLTFEDGTVYRLGSITTIGKDEDADIKISGMLAAKKLATIIRGREIFKIIRKGGLSSLKVNGEKIDEHILKNGDVIVAGNQTMTFRIMEEAAEEESLP